jgi:hypothetical protein
MSMAAPYLSERSTSLLWLVTGASVALFMASNDSLWIDELATMTVVETESLQGAVNAIIYTKNSEAQMPGYLLYAWAWEKLLGSSEWALRLNNAPWLALAVWAMARIGAALGSRWTAPLLLVQPFVWSYVDEFRPYAMQVAGGALMAWGCVQYFGKQGAGATWAASLSLGAWIVCSASMLGAVPTFFVYAALAWIRRRRHWAIDPAAARLLIAANSALGALGAYYAWTLARGSGGAKLWDVGPANLAMVIYEFFGFFGVGPARETLREAARGGASALTDVFAPYLLGVAALTTCYLLLLVTQLTGVLREQDSVVRTSARLSLFVLLSSLVGLFGLAAFAKWPFWGRHLAPVFAFWMLLLGIFVRQASTSATGRLITVCLFLTLAASSLTVRHSPAHRHDDYRGAVSHLRRALDRGDHVWWAARNLSDSKLYGSGLQSRAAAGSLTWLHGVPAEQVADLAPPDVVFLSKSDIYDPEGAIAAYLDSNEYVLDARLKAFQIWRAPHANSLGAEGSDAKAVP